MTSKRICIGLGISIIIGISLVIAWKLIPGKEYRTFLSPDGRFKVVVFRSRQLFGTMPGQASDAPGTVCLYATGTGKLLEKTRIEMVQLVDVVTWSSTNVDIKLVADWKLP